MTDIRIPEMPPHKSVNERVYALENTVRALSDRIETHTHPVEGYRPYTVTAVAPHPPADVPADEAIRKAEDAIDGAVDALPSDGIKRVTIGPLGEFRQRFLAKLQDSDDFHEFSGGPFSGFFIGTTLAENIAIEVMREMVLAVALDDPRLDPLDVSDEDVAAAEEAYERVTEASCHMYGIRPALEAYARRVNAARGYTEVQS